MNFESQPELPEKYKPMDLSFSSTIEDLESGTAVKSVDQSELYSLPLIPVGAEGIVSLDHHDPTEMSIEERGKYIRKIVDAYNAVKEDGGDDDKTYIMARWLQEALLVPNRTGENAVTTAEVDQVLISQELNLGNVMTIIGAGLKDRTGRAIVEGDDIEIIKLGMDSISHD
jgi:hypothetical protein